MLLCLMLLMSICAKGQYFTEPKSANSQPDENGFVRNWLLLEPINKPNPSNVVFVDSYLQENLCKEFYKDQFKKFPIDNQKVKVEKQTLKWHELQSTDYNIHLYRFATQRELQRYGVIFNATTVIDCPKDIENVRLSVGSNSASIWWIDGKQTLILSGDRRMVVDDCMSERINLSKGKHVIRGVIINGPGMSNFCLRFVDEKFNAVKDFLVYTKN